MYYFVIIKWKYLSVKKEERKFSSSSDRDQGATKYTRIKLNQTLILRMLSHSNHHHYSLIVTFATKKKFISTLKISENQAKLYLQLSCGLVDTHTHHQPVPLSTLKKWSWLQRLKEDTIFVPVSVDVSQNQLFQEVTHHIVSKANQLAN